MCGAAFALAIMLPAVIGAIHLIEIEMRHRHEMERREMDMRERDGGGR